MAVALATDPAEARNDVRVSGSVTVATEGIGRGFSVTDHKPFYAVGIQIETGGFYASAATDRFEIAGARHEAYVIGGYAHHFGALTLDTSVVRYFYDAKAADFWEGAISARYAVGPAMIEIAARGSKNYFVHSGHALYTYANVSAPVWHKGGSSVSMSARLGRQQIQRNATLGTPDWTYWNVGISLHRAGALIDLTYHDTDVPRSLGLPAGRRLVGSLTVGF